MRMPFENVIKKFSSQGLLAKDIERYLEAGGDINRRHPDSGWALLHFAAEDRNSAVIRLLVSRGANLNAQDRFGQTPLHIAVDSDLDTSGRDGHPATDMPTTLELVAAGADRSVTAADGRTPRDFALAYRLADLYDSLRHRDSAWNNGCSSRATIYGINALALPNANDNSLLRLR